MYIFKLLLKSLYYLQLITFVCIIILGALLVLNPDYAVKRFAEFIVIDAEPKQSDMIASISGDDATARINEGIRLFEAGYGDELMLSGYRDIKGFEKYFEATDIDANDIHYDQATSTYENAVFVKAYMEERGYHSLIIVCSPQQSRRALMTFRHVMPDFDLSVSYSKDHKYDPDLIFEDKTVRENFANEAIKYVYYLFKYGLK